MNKGTGTPPVAIFGFIRPQTTVRVFGCVREARPDKLFLCLDAPREGHPGDIEKCEAVKRIFEGVDWPCEVFKNYAEKNMGCRRRVASGISWVFEHVEEAIILEDDCLPHPSFFAFCGELLERYRHDMRVGMIAGHVAHLGGIDVQQSYYFDRLNTIWGWATWRRAWCKVDESMVHWPRFNSSKGLQVICRTPFQLKHLSAMFDAVHHNRCSSWATAWALTCIRENFLCVHPTINLVSNIGCGSDATHTGMADSPWSCRPLQPMAFPLIHPFDMTPNWAQEQKTMRCLYAVPLIEKIKARLSKIFHARSHKGC